MPLGFRRRLITSSLVAAAALLGAAPARTFDPAPYVHAQRLVDIGGRRINLYCTGHGTPTVILDTDGHEGTIAWRYVQPVTAKSTRVCSYDAPGFGFSDPAPPPRDALAFVNDLHTLLMRAGIRSPLILVGYQPSGLYDRLYANRYVHDVAGMILVDPVETHRKKRVEAVAPALTPLLAGVKDYDQQCYRAALSKTIRPGTAAFANCVIPLAGPTVPHAITLLNQHQWERPGTWRDYIAETASGEDTNSREVEQSQRTYGDMPLIVLTSDTSALQLPLPPRQLITLTAARQRWHEQIAKLSTTGTDFVIDGSSDSIAVDEPFAVVSAIDEVVVRARYRARTETPNAKRPDRLGGPTRRRRK